MNSSLLLQILGAAGLSGILGAVVNGFINRRKLGAEATQIITDAAGGMVERLQSEIKRKDQDMDEMRTDLNSLRRQVDAHESEMYTLRETLQIHAVWDHRAIRALEQARTQGCEFPEIPHPPPLFPEYRHQT